MAGRAKLWLTLLLGSAAFAVVLGAAATAGATAGATARAHWIVFSAVPSGQHVDQLYRIRSSGTGLKRVTKGQYPSIAPAFSPDRKRIAFARPGVGIITMDVNGKALRRLTTNGRDSFPAWSPDGKRMAFVRPHKAAWSIYVMASSGGPARRLAKAPPAGRPTWSSGGLLIPSGGDLLKISPANGGVLKYFDATIDAVWGLNTVALAPDDSSLTYLGARAPESGDKECGEGPCQRFALYKESLLTKNKTPRLVGKNIGPATFAPNGKQLAFIAHNKLVLWTIANRRSKPLPLGGIYAAVAAPPAWQP